MSAAADALKRAQEAPRKGRSALQLARAQGKVPARIDSPIEALFSLQLRFNHAPEHVRNYVGAIPGRKLEVDFAWPSLRMGIEVQGAVHRIKEHFQRDAEKHALALLAGWILLPVTGRQIRDGRAIGWALQLLEMRARELTK